jgi:hypothetical protein
MRYPVAESFAAPFTQEVYRLMLEMGRPLPQARAWATASAARPPATPERPPLSLITPAVYGIRALELTLRAPARDAPPPFSYQSTKLAGVPGQPRAFAGRSVPMTRVAQALARGSGRTAVVIEGMDRIGKTTLALETVHGQAGNFDVVAWYECDRASAADGATGGGAAGRSAADGLAGVLSTKIPGLDVSALRGPGEQARGLAARLSAYFAGTRALIVIDRADAQLTDAGQWADERLGLLVRALAVGQARLIITSRRPLADAGQWAVAPVTTRLAPLSGAEAALLAGEFPGLKALRDGAGQSLSPPLSSASARGLAAGVLAATRGHPALLATAAEHASSPLALAAMTITARDIWARHAGDPDAEAAYLEILSAWEPG